MSAWIGWLLATATAAIAALFGGAWWSERKRSKQVTADAGELAKKNTVQKIVIQALKLKEIETKRTLEAYQQGVKAVERDSVTTGLSARVSRGISRGRSQGNRRGPNGEPGGD